MLNFAIKNIEHVLQSAPHVIEYDMTIERHIYFVCTVSY
jgi:hypothetical protein